MNFKRDRNFEILRDSYEARISDLLTRIESLEKEKVRLLEALLSVHSPDAYREMKSEEAEMKSATEPLSKEETHRRDVATQTYRKWVQALESPLFENYQDMEAQMSKWLKPTPEDLTPPSVHGNSES